MIKQSALKFQKILGYTIEIEFDGKRYTPVFINFMPSDYFHLAGLHKLKDVNFVGSKENIFNKILTDDILCGKIDSSIYIEDILERINALNYMKNIFKNKFEIYPYKRNSNRWSKIKADYLIKFYYKSKQCFLFLKERDGVYYVCNSIIQDNKNYTHRLYHLKFKKCKVKKNR